MSPIRARRGDFIDHVLDAAGGAPPYKWRERKLPDGLKLRVTNAHGEDKWGWTAICGVPLAGGVAELVLTDNTGAAVADDREVVLDSWHTVVTARGNYAPRAAVPGTTVFVEGDWGTGSAFVLVPGGEFLIGYHATQARDGWLGFLKTQGMRIDPQYARRQWPAGAARLNGFLIGECEVTNAEYARFVAEGEHRPPGHWNGVIPPSAILDHPVVNVSYDDAWAYCRWKTEVARAADIDVVYRLPSHWQWEKAARGASDDAAAVDGAARLYPWGDIWGPGNLATLCGGTVPVMRYGARSRVGVLDMAGNVSEWVDGGQAHEGRLWKHVRGAPWRLPGHLHGFSFVCGERLIQPEYTGDAIGFRCVIEFPPSPPLKQALIPLGGDMYVDGSGGQVFIGPFWMSRFAVSNDEFARFRPAHEQEFKEPDRWRPVTGVSHQDALAFCAWKSQEDGRPYHLPLRQEFARACRGGGAQPRTYPWGEEYSRYVCNSHESRWGGAIDVFSLSEGATPEGVYGLVGNVFEWLADGDAVGGSWLSTCESYGTCPYPERHVVDGAPGPDIGFRYVTN